MKVFVKYQDAYSRGQLLLRTLFGWLYILLPHVIVLYIFLIPAMVFWFLSFWIILFTGKLPKFIFDYQSKLLDWELRLSAVFMNLIDGYPKIGFAEKNANAYLEIENPERLSRGLVLLKTIFGLIYAVIPHFFILYFRLLWCLVLAFLAWWVVLFTGKYPASWHEFQVGTLRWQFRVSCYMMLLSDEYPRFSGKE